MRLVAVVVQVVHLVLAVLVDRVDELGAAVAVGVVVVRVQLLEVVARAHVDGRGALEGLDPLVEVAKVAGAPAALRDAAGEQTLVDAVGAHVALLDHALVLVEVAHAVGAHAHARLAPDAHVLVDVDDAVLALVGRAGGADLHALGVLAVLALERQEVHLDVGELAALGLGHRPHADDLVPVVADRHVVLNLASHGARKAADASVQIGDDCIAAHSCTPFLSA